jgi:hypothetical protein
MAPKVAESSREFRLEHVVGSPKDLGDYLPIAVPAAELLGRAAIDLNELTERARKGIPEDFTEARQKIEGALEVIKDPDFPPYLSVYADGGDFYIILPNPRDSGEA